MLQRLESMKPFEALTTSNSKAWEVAPDSSLARDDAKINPYHLSHLAWQALGVGVITCSVSAPLWSAINTVPLVAPQ